MISYLTKKGRSNITICEDSLTSAVFDCLKYLPIEIFYTILKNALYQNKLPSNSGEILKIDFWDKWNAKNTTNTNFVEPDLLIQFQDFDLILEAKRYDNFQQSQHQMQNQVQAYHNVFDQNKEVYFIQVGGLHSKDDEPDYEFDGKKIKIAKTDWSRLLHEVIKQRNLLDVAQLTQTNAYCRILDDVRKAFEMHNFYEMKWLKDIKFSKINVTEFTEINFLKK